MSFGVIETILPILFVAVLISWLFWRLHLPIVSGYIIIGIIVGPYVFHWFSATELTREIAEYGVVFLLFTIGLEFSLTSLFSMYRIVFYYGALQVALSMIVTIIMGFLIGLNWVEAIIVATIVSTSSTAIVLKQLKEQKEVHTSYGRNAVGILLFQDLAAIIFLVNIPSLVSAHLFIALGWSLVKGFVAIAFILTVGQLILRPLFHKIARTKSSEIFLLTTLLVALGSAWISSRLGLPLALGAFVAGVMLSETEFRYQLEHEMRPFRDVLLAIFFISIGLQFDIPAIPQTWPWILLLYSALVVFKTILIFLLGIILGHTPSVSLRTGLILAQGSEFGFTILFLADKYKLLTPDYGEVVLGALLLSIITSTLVIKFSESITKYLEKAMNLFIRRF